MTTHVRIAPGTRVRLNTEGKRLGFLHGSPGVVLEPQPHQLDDEESVAIDGYDSFYYVPVDRLIVDSEAEAEPEKESGSADSFFLFEALLDSADEAHPNSKLFYNELIAAGLLHAQKQRDYGKPGDPFANVRSSEEWGIPSWVGAMVRLNDKVKRLQSLARTGGLANESAIDSFRDIAVYALIALVLYGQEAQA